jgi:hypothetical protein
MDIDDVGLDIPDCFIVEAQLRNGLAAHIVDEDICRFQKPAHHRDIVRLLQVEHDRALAAVQRHMGRAHRAGFGMPPHITRNVTNWRFHLDDVRPHIGQHLRGIGPKDDTGQVDDTDTFKHFHR